jgi:hypothetical protein
VPAGVSKKIENDALPMDGLRWSWSILVSGHLLENFGCVRAPGPMAKSHPIVLIEELEVV